MSMLMKSSRAAAVGLAEAGAPPRRHPLAGRTLSGADMIMQVVADEGVDTIFGYSGGRFCPPTTRSFGTTRRVPRMSKSSS